MASLIEEEATAKADRHKIASVFYNRLAEKMPLQTDPTVLYAAGKHKSRVYYKDLKIDSPFNTYKHKGCRRDRLQMPVIHHGKRLSALTKRIISISLQNQTARSFSPKH